MTSQFDSIFSHNETDDIVVADAKCFCRKQWIIIQDMEELFSVDSGSINEVRNITPLNGHLSPRY